MAIQQMLRSWGIDLPEGNDDLYLPEYLLQNYSEKCFFADFFPRTISRSCAHKYTQIERRIYNLVCERMYNAVLKLWVYDNLYFESELLPKRIPYTSVFKRPVLLKIVADDCIEQEQHLRILMQLSKRNAIDLVLVFERLHMVIVPSWSCFFVFTEDVSFAPLIKEVFGTEGLCLRKASAEWEP